MLLKSLCIYHASIDLLARQSACVLDIGNNSACFPSKLASTPVLDSGVSSTPAHKEKFTQIGRDLRQQAHRLAPACTVQHRLCSPTCPPALRKITPPPTGTTRSTDKTTNKLPALALHFLLLSHRRPYLSVRMGTARCKSKSNSSRQQTTATVWCIAQHLLLAKPDLAPQAARAQDCCCKKSIKK